MSSVFLENISKTYGLGSKDAFKAVKSLNLEIRDKEFMVLVGPSGCGKSTTLRMIAGLEEVTEGKLSIANRVVNDVLPKDRGIAMVFQNYALYPHMTVAANMAFGLKLRKIPKTIIRERVEEAADILGLTSMLQRKPKALSGGQRQRVALGRAIVRKPDVFLFDEPLSNLDAKMRVQMRSEIAKLHGRLNATMIYVTHDQTEAMTLGDRICVMNNGEIMQLDEPINIYEKPANKFTASFIGLPQMNFFKGKVTTISGISYFEIEGESMFRLPLSKRMTEIAEAHSYDSFVLGIRPEHFLMCDGPDPAAFHAKVDVGEPLGAESYIHLSTQKGNKMVVRLPGVIQVALGEELYLKPDLEQAHLFDAVTEKSLSHPS